VEAERRPYADITCAREELTKLMEGASEDAIRVEEGLLDTVAMVNIDINVEHARVIPTTMATIRGTSSRR